ncbi:hypothetical protein [Nonomuraea sp. NPDC049480]|uniref:hypothetical protein n=1 Tax=Nonomuraea sp. NPDC049480 TaxID=3364353 RepID=UPI0037A23C70
MIGFAARISARHNTTLATTSAGIGPLPAFMPAMVQRLAVTAEAGRKESHVLASA